MRPFLRRWGSYLFWAISVALLGLAPGGWWGRPWYQRPRFWVCSAVVLGIVVHALTRGRREAAERRHLDRV